jgi:hypothetical protein
MTVGDQVFRANTQNLIAVKEKPRKAAKEKSDAYLFHTVDLCGWAVHSGRFSHPNAKPHFAVLLRLRALRVFA